MKSIAKRRKKELRKIYEDKLGEEFVKGIKDEPICSPYEWVGMIMK
jgi:hypothetical protein